MRDGLASAPSDSETRIALLDELNLAMEHRDLYDEAVWRDTILNGESHAMLAKGLDSLSDRQLVRFNRLLFEAAVPSLVVKSPRNLQTKVAVPRLKDTMIPMGLLYIPFVILIIVATSNTVNLTDGLTVLAIGACVVCLPAFPRIASIFGRADCFCYLCVT